MLYSVLVAIDVVIAIALIGLILMQQGKGASVGAAFGSGASGTVFGARGSASFITRSTAVLATLFFVNSTVLAYLASNQPEAISVIDSVVNEQQVEAPAVLDVPAIEEADVVEEVIEESEPQGDVPDIGDSQAADIPE